MNITSEIGLPLNTVNLEHLRRIMALRLEEVFQLIAQDLAPAGLLEYLRAGVFLCGGGARIPEIAPARRSRFSNCRSRSGKPIPSAASSPRWINRNSPRAIGLVKFGSFKFRKREARPTLGQNLKSVFSKLLPR